MENFNIVEFLVALVLTTIYYGAFPILFSKTRTKPITTRQYRWLCIGVTFALWILIGVISGEVSTGAPALLWGTIFYRKGKGILQKKKLTEHNTEEPQNVTITCDKCGKKFADNPENYTMIGVLKYCRFCIDEMGADFEEVAALQNPSFQLHQAATAEAIKLEEMEQTSVGTNDTIDTANQVRFCRKCGKKLYENAKFCNYCGASVIFASAETNKDNVANQVNHASMSGEEIVLESKDSEASSTNKQPLSLSSDALSIEVGNKKEVANWQKDDGDYEKNTIQKLLICPDCGGKVGVHANACPHCGCSMSYILERLNSDFS